MVIPKKYRDLSMQILIDYQKQRKPGHSIGPDYLRYKGLPQTIDPLEVISFLKSKKLIEYTEDNGIWVRDPGMTYFEDEADAAALRKEAYRHNWKIAFFSAFAGALLARPLWVCLDGLWSLMLGLLGS